MAKYYTIKLTKAQLQMLLQAMQNLNQDIVEWQKSGVSDKKELNLNERVYEILLKELRGEV
jgi:hypothetical protein